MVVAVDAAGYANYAQLLPLQEPGGVLRYGLHPSLPGLQGSWSAGKHW